MSENKLRELDKPVTALYNRRAIKTVEPTPQINEKIIKDAEKIHKEHLKNLETASRSKSIWE
ncbi:MAG: hypothetical protein Q7T59_04890 [Candidatus Woesebacteria bacterium]|nr:hypothetical protein [Candidatus Woesebacteria bacterium]